MEPDDTIHDRNSLIFCYQSDDVWLQWKWVPIILGDNIQSSDINNHPAFPALRRIAPYYEARPAI